MTEIYQQTLNGLEANLQSRLKKKLSTLEDGTEELLSQHNQSLKKISEKSEQTLIEIGSKHKQIEDYQRQALKWHWWKPAATGLILVVAIAAGSWGVLTYLGNRLVTTMDELSQRQAVLAEVKKEGNWSRCGKQGAVCVQIDESKGYEGGYYVLKTD